MATSNRIFLQGTTKLEEKYVPKLIRAIKTFRAGTVKDLKEYGIDYTRNRLQLYHITPDLPKIITAIYQDAGLFGARLTYNELRKLAAQKAGGFGRNETWIQSVLEFLQSNLLRLVNGISNTMREDIIKVLEKGVDEGWSIDKIVDELQRGDLTRARARVIARTEIIRAANVGHSVGAKSTPYEVDKKWSAARDHRTRHSHKLINGHITSEEGTFKVAIYQGDKLIGYENMLYPGDQTASAANTINCRCRVQHTPKRDAAGKLIMRPANQITPVVPMRRPQEYTPAQIAAIRKMLINNIVVGVE